MGCIFSEDAKYKTAKPFSLIGKFRAYVLECYDGDTLVCSVKYEGIFLRVRVRIKGCDAYEVKVPKMYKGRRILNREELAIKGKQARDFLATMTEGKYVTLLCEGFEKFGRVLADAKVLHQGVETSACALLIERRHAFPYSGKGEKAQVAEYILAGPES